MCSMAPKTTMKTLASSPSHLQKKPNWWSAFATVFGIISTVLLISIARAHSSSTCPSGSGGIFGSAASDECSAENVDNGSSPTQTLERGKEIGDKITAKELARAYQTIKEEYGRLALHESMKKKWQLLTSHSDGTEVSLLNHETDPSCPYVRMTSIMPGTVQDVWDFLALENWSETMPKMDPFYEGLSVLGDYRHKNIEMKLARKTLKRILTFAKRDFTFVSVSDQPQSSGKWVSGTVSVISDEIPRADGYVRAFQDSIAFYEAEEDCKVTGQPRTRLTIVFRIDLNDSSEGGNGGYIPMWMYVKTVGTTGMLSVQNMKKQLQEVVDTRMRNEVDKFTGNQMSSCRKNWLAKIMNKNSSC